MDCFRWVRVVFGWDVVDTHAVIERQMRRRLPAVLNKEMQVPVNRILMRLVVDLLELRDGAGQQVGGTISHVHIARGIHGEVKKTILRGAVFLVLLVLNELNSGLGDVLSVGPRPVAR